MNALAFIRESADYFVAAKAIDDEIGDDRGYEILSPKACYYNAFHSLELAAKAVLVNAGYTEKQLKTVSHSLSQAIGEARKSGLALLLTPEEERLVGLLDRYYLRLRYPESGEIELPVWGALTDLLVKVLKATIQAVPGGEAAIRPEVIDRLSGFVSWHA